MYVDSQRYRVLFAIVIALVLGCSDSNFVPVSGTVTLDGKPLQSASVVFQHNGPEGFQSIGGTNEKGEFELTTHDRPGAYVGKYSVAIRKVEIEGIEATVDGLSGPINVQGYKETWLVPSKYGTHKTSELNVEIEKETHDVEIKLVTPPEENNNE